VATWKRRGVSVLILLLAVCGCRRATTVSAADASMQSADDAHAMDATTDAHASDARSPSPPRDQGNRMRKQSPLPSDPSAATIAAWWKALDAAEKKGFETLIDWSMLPDGDLVKLNSQEFAPRVLMPDFDPWTTGGSVERSVHRATATTHDTIRHRFRLTMSDPDGGPPHDVAVVVTETVLYLRIDLEDAARPLLVAKEEERAEIIAALAARVMRLDGTHYARTTLADATHSWTFLYDRLVEGSRFSSAPSIDIDPMWSWSERADGGIQHGKPYFVAFRKFDLVTGKFVRPMNPKRWFDGTCWTPYR
jgi:hypothetical protein